jgi:hypothetical protein
MIEWFEDLALGMRFKSAEQRDAGGHQVLRGGIRSAALPPRRGRRREDGVAGPRRVGLAYRGHCHAIGDRRAPIRVASTVGDRGRRVALARTGAPRPTCSTSRARWSSSRRRRRSRRAWSRSNGPPSTSTASRSTPLRRSGSCPTGRADPVFPDFCQRILLQPRDHAGSVHRFSRANAAHKENLVGSRTLAMDHRRRMAMPCRFRPGHRPLRPIGQEGRIMFTGR